MSTFLLNIIGVLFENTDFKCHVKVRDGKIPRTDLLNGPKPEGVRLVLPI